jgi:RNA 3'-terminal phosphate cyclase (ATP)
MSHPVQIDGSHGEGGGQIIRTSLSLAALTGRAVEVHSVRAGRSRPGLQRQHLTAVLAAAALCDAEVQGASVGSTHFTFRPQARPQAQPYDFDIGTAGATPLVAQTLLFPLAQAGVETHVRVTGGTHVSHAPTADYLEAVYIPALRRAGLAASVEVSRAGFFPKGSGLLELALGPGTPVQALDFSERGKLVSLKAYVTTGNLPAHVSERGAATVERFMKGVGRKVEVERRELSSLSPGAAVTLAAECEGGFAGFSALGERGKPMEEVAAEPCEAFMAWWKSGAACDEHLADQLVLPLAWARGESRWTTPMVTEHLRTVLWLTAQFLPLEYRLEPQDEGCTRVVVQGAGEALGVKR